MYNVMVENKANGVFDTANDAMQWAMSYAYLGLQSLRYGMQKLERGEEFRYAYGFTTVHIVPVAKRQPWEEHPGLPQP